MHGIEARGAQLVRKLAKKDAVHVQTLSFELDAAITERIGSLFGVISVDTKERKGAALAAHIEDAMARAADDAVRRMPPDAHHDQVFEAAIGGVNKALVRLFGEFGLEIEPEIVTSAIVAFKGADTVVATWGRPSILLFHPSSQGVRILDLADGGAEAERAPFRGANAFRCYGSVIAGRVGPRDRMLLSTIDLRSHADDESIVQAVLSPDPATASAALNGILPNEAGIAMASLVLDASPYRYLENGGAASFSVARARPKAAQTAQSAGTNHSLDRLSETHTNTNETLSPSLVGTVTRAVSSLLPAAGRAPVSAAPSHRPTLHAQTEPQPTPSLQTAPVSSRPNTWKIVVKVAKFTWKAIVAISIFLYALTSADRRKEMLANIDTVVAGTVSKLNGLSLRSRALLFAALVLAALAQGSVVYSAYQGKQEEKVAAYERSVDEIAQTIDAAESSMIYRDETRAKELMDQAVVAIAALPVKTEEQIAKKSGLEAKIEAARAGMRREVALGEPQTVATVAEEGGELSMLTFDGTTLWTVAKSGSVLRVATNGQATDALGKMSTTPLMLVPLSTGVFAVSTDGTGTLFTGKSEKPQRVALAAGDSPTEASLYNGRLYVLDAAHNRIMRHAADSQGFGEGQHYLKDGTDLSGAVSMAIDGMVWSLKKNGVIVRVIQGKQEAYTAAAIEPSVTNALRLRTPSAEDDLYVLDGSPSRIIRYSKKTGAMVAQFVSPQLAGATDLAIEKGGGSAYVAVGNKILKFAIPASK